MGIGDVKETIRQGNEAIDDAQQTVTRIRADLTEATNLALAVVKGTAHPKVEVARHELAEAAHEIELTLRRLATSKQQAGAYLTRLG